MADSLVLDPLAPSTNGSSSSPIVQRRVDFHTARKPFNGFGNGGGDFRVESLKPVSDSKRTNPDQPAKGGRRHDGSECLENGLDLELGLGITVRKIGAGLENLGNTCFLNSVLQCLTHTEPLAAYLQSGKHQNSCKVAGFCALCAIQKHVSRALQSTGRILAPKDLVSNLRCISRNFRKARQEDAHEYMVNLLESMHKCCLPSGVPSESPSAYDKSLVHKIFGGRLRSQVKCMQCNYCSNTFDPFLDLSIEIAQADSLYKALADFTAAEQLDGGERQYQCQRCKQKVRALKQLTVHKAPYVLTIHLKRFRAYNPGQKINKKVQFGPTLDLKPFVSGSYEGDLKYTLYGVLVHCGFSIHSGHYYSYVRTSGGTWYNLDDNRVVAVGEKTVMEQKAYMLFYVRDRRNYAPRKSVDVGQKENMKANNGGNKTLFTSKQGYGGSVHNGIVENRLNGLACSATKKDALNVGSTKLGYNGPVQNGTVDIKSKGASSSSLSQKDREDALIAGSTKKSCNESIQLNIVENGTHAVDCFTTKKDASNVDNRTNGAAGSAQKDASSVGLTKESSLQNNGLISAESSVSEKDAVVVTSLKTPIEPSSEPSLEAGLSKNGLKGLSLPNSNLPKQFQQMESVCDPNPADVRGTTAGKSKKDLLVAVDVLPVSFIPTIFPIDKLPSEKASPKNNSVSKAGASSRAPSDKFFEKIGPVRSSNQPSCEKSQFGDLNDGAVSDSLISKGSGSGQRFAQDKSMEQLGSSIITNESLNKEAHSSRSKRKMRRKLRKFHVASMRLGPNILFGAFGLRKKKFKKREHHGLDSKNLSREHFLATNCVSSDVGPSTSDKTRRISSCASRVEKKAAKSASKRVDFAASVNDDEETFSARSGQNGAVLAADKQSEKASRSCAASKHSNGRDSDNLKGSKGESMQNGVIMSMLTRGLEETYVPRWEGIDSSPSQIFVQSKTSESISIGFVGDEWDKEYDTGKRKKVRTFKHSFDGPNPFQEVASKNMPSKKKPRMDRSSSGNRPFRIQS